MTARWWMRLVFPWMLAAVSGCDGNRSPTRPEAIPNPGSSEVRWSADGTVTEVTGDPTACNLGPDYIAEDFTVGGTRREVEWRTSVDGSSVAFTQYWKGYALVDFSGTLTGERFEVEVWRGLDWSECRLLGGELAGSFSADGLSFEAREISRLGSVEERLTVVRSWVGRRIQAAGA